MPNLGGAEILVILLVALLVLGPDKLPGAARSIGKGLAQLRKLSGGFEQEIRSAMHETGITTAPQGSPGPSAVPGSGVHPGLGPGPRLEPDSVSLGPTGSTAPAASPDTPAGSVRPRVEGPDESFS
jgi:sec-independent protein translocase protein TatA